MNKNNVNTKERMMYKNNITEMIKSVPFIKITNELHHYEGLVLRSGLDKLHMISVIHFSFVQLFYNKLSSLIYVSLRIILLIHSTKNKIKNK